MVPLKWSESVLMTISIRGCPYSAENYYISTLNHDQIEDKDQNSPYHVVNRIDFRFRTASAECTLFHGTSRSAGSKDLITAVLHDSR